MDIESVIMQIYVIFTEQEPTPVFVGVGKIESKPFLVVTQA